MSRTLTAAVDTALQQPNIPMLILISMDFASGFLRMCNASYNFTYGGFTYLGAGRLANVKNMEEGTDQKMYGTELSLSGIDPGIVSIALAEPYQQRPITILFAPLDSNYQIIANPPVVWKGRMDQMNIEMGETATITLTAESRLTDWNRPNIRRYNDEDQKAFFPTDKGFEYVAQMVDKSLNWGIPIPRDVTAPTFDSNRYGNRGRTGSQTLHYSSGGTA